MGPTDVGRRLGLQSRSSLSHKLAQKQGGQAKGAPSRHLTVRLWLRRWQGRNDTVPARCEAMRTSGQRESHSTSAPLWAVPGAGSPPGGGELLPLVSHYPSQEGYRGLGLGSRGHGGGGPGWRRERPLDSSQFEKFHLRLSNSWSCPEPSHPTPRAPWPVRHCVLGSMGTRGQEPRLRKGLEAAGNAGPTGKWWVALRLPAVPGWPPPRPVLPAACTSPSPGRPSGLPRALGHRAALAGCCAAPAAHGAGVRGGYPACAAARLEGGCPSMAGRGPLGGCSQRGVSRTWCRGDGR